jgi:hypothetical protein
VLAAVHEAFRILKTAIRTGGTPEPLPELPRFLRQEAAILNDSVTGSRVPWPGAAGPSAVNRGCRHFGCQISPAIQQSGPLAILV